jgi:hypothetical protein
MTYNLITILYEDHPGPKTNPKDFGLHRFIAACIFDRIDQDYWELDNALTCNPRKGNSRLLDSIESDFEILSFDGRNVVAVFDHDRITDLLKIGKGTPDDDIIGIIKKRCPVPDKLYVFLIDQNLETVIRSIEQCDNGNLIDKRWFDKAVRKRMNERDLVFRKASQGGSRAIRDCVLEKMDVLKRMVREVIKLLQEQNAR